MNHITTDHNVPRLFLVFSSRSKICMNLLTLLNDQRIAYSPICIDSSTARKKCKSWGITVVPTIIDVSNGHAEFYEGLWSCQDLIAPSIPLVQPVHKPKHEYVMAKPEPFQLLQKEEIDSPKETPQPAQRPDPRPDPTEIGHIDPDQDSLDFSLSGNEKVVSTLIDLDLLKSPPPSEESENEIVNHDKIVDPHVKQRNKLKSFHDKKNMNAKKLEERAKTTNEENAKEDLITRAKRMQKNRDKSDTDLHRSTAPKVPKNSIDTLARP